MPTIWELDFYSRPILDENQKKTWEVVICESPLNGGRSPDSLFRFAKFCPSTEVNSLWLKTALEEAMAKSGQTPTKVRFFRRQMTNMITKACQDLEINAQPSRRTYGLNQWLRERIVNFYPSVPGYQEGQPSPLSSATSFNEVPPQPLPDALVGQQWAFVTLEASAFSEMAEWAIDFGESFPLELVNLPPTAKVPGVVIFSPRALPLAGWISGLELAFLKVTPAPYARLVLETGASERWVLATLTDSAQALTESQNFEAAKAAAQQVHFLAVQSDPNSEQFAGFWLLQELNLS